MRIQYAGTGIEIQKRGLVTDTELVVSRQFWGCLREREPPGTGHQPECGRETDRDRVPKEICHIFKLQPEG